MRHMKRLLAICYFYSRIFLDIKHRYQHIAALEITDQSRPLHNSDICQIDAVIIGHESTGIRQRVLDICEQAIHIQMYGINGSMNISHALAIFLFEWRRQLNQ